MPTLDTLRSNIEKAEGRINVYLAVKKRTPKQQAALDTNLGSYTRHVRAFLAAVTKETIAAAAKELAEQPETADTGEAPPADTGSNRQSSALYNDWATRRYGANLTAPVEGTPEELRALAAAGRLGSPLAPAQPGIDWSLFTGVVSEATGTGDRYHAYLRGQEVAVENGDGSFDTVAFATRNGIDAS